MLSLYRAVMDSNVNPLRALHPAQRFQTMAVLGTMWTTIFCGAAIVSQQIFSPADPRASSEMPAARHRCRSRATPSRLRTWSSVISSSKRSRKASNASSFIFFCWWVMFWPSPAVPIP